MSTIAVGDRVYAWYREHSIPTRSLGIITEITQGGWVTVQMDTERNEDDSDLVRVQMNFIEPAADA